MSAIVEHIRKVTDGHNLSHDEAMDAMEIIMTGQATDSQIAALVTALRMKGESDKEITGFARVMRSHAEKVQATSTGLVDTCGTGGDAKGTFNISTAAAFVAAAAGAKVAKHGNRSVSSKSGSADVLEALGVNINLGPADVAKCIDTVGVGFMFAPIFHGAMKYAVAPRREIGIRTVFNILGPLTNPAGAEYQVLGVYDEELTGPLARVLGQLGTTRALVVHGAGGLDELSLLGGSIVSELKDGKVKTSRYVPEDFGLKQAKLEELAGGGADENARIIRSIFSGEETGAKADIVVMNAGAAMFVTGRADNFMDGAQMAQEAVKSGAAAKVLDHLIEFSTSLGQAS